MNAAEARTIPRTTPPAALPTIIPRLLDAAEAACWAMWAGLLVGVPVRDGVGVPDSEVDTEGIKPYVVEPL